MKIFVIFSFLAFILLSSIALAEIRYSGISITIDDKGKIFVEMTLTLSETIDEFSVNVLGDVKNLKATTDIGTINCSLKKHEISSISCKANVLAKSIIKLSFEADSVKQVENKSYLNVKLSFDKFVEYVVFSAKLPEGAKIESFSPKETKFSSEAFIVWSFLNIMPNEPLEFEVIYEFKAPEIPAPEVFPLKYLLAGVAITSIAAFLVFKRIRKPAEVIVSVLDEYEKKVINIITSLGGETTQKKVVQETNLSKAKVSRIVKSLEKRGLIKVERIGRTNKLKLVKEKFKF